MTTAVALGILYPLVRRVDQVTLRLVWSYTLVAAAIVTLVFFGAVFAGYTVFHFSLIVMLVGLLLLFPLLWFARQASRHSLTHAFFLLIIVGGLPLPDLSDSLPFYLRGLWGLAGGVPAVWLLANFDLRGPVFRRWTVVAIGALEGLHFLRAVLKGLALLSTAILTTSFEVLGVLGLSLLPFALIYFVRVRQPAAKVPVTPPREER